MGLAPAFETETGIRDVRSSYAIASAILKNEYHDRSFVRYDLSGGVFSTCRLGHLSLADIPDAKLEERLNFPSKASY